MANTSSNLNHIYFFIDQTSSETQDGHADDGSSATASNQSTRQHSRTSSPGSIDTANSSATLTATQSTWSSDMNPLAKAFTPQSKQSSTIPPPPTATGLYELRKTPNKGLGLIATTAIKRGTLIICEEPLLKIDDDLVHQAWGPYCRLGNAQKAAFDSLHCHEPEGANFEIASRRFLIDYTDDSLDEEDVAELVADQVRVMSIFAVNNFARPPNGIAVFATASRLNHSCVPNVHHSYNPNIGKETVYAVRDIVEGEELFTTYCGGDSAYQLRSQRQEKLRSFYGFTCTCEACSDPTGTSDGRRELLGSLAWSLSQYMQGAVSQNAFIPASPATALKQAEDLLSVMFAEGLCTIELTKAFRMASRLAFDAKEYVRAMEYAQDEAEVERNCLGSIIEDLVKSGTAAQSWVDRLNSWIHNGTGHSPRGGNAKADMKKKKKKKKVLTPEQRQTQAQKKKDRKDAEKAGREEAAEKVGHENAVCEKVAQRVEAVKTLDRNAVVQIPRMAGEGVAGELWSMYSPVTDASG